MPIYWALGYHLCRWGYGNSSSTWEVVKSLRNYGIPQVKLTTRLHFVCLYTVRIIDGLVRSQDVQWNDIDYMDRKLDFTLDAQFSTLPEMVRDLHTHDQHYVLIVV